MKKRSPTDATHRNVKASKKRDDMLTERVRRLEAEVKRLDRVIRSHTMAFMEGKWA